MRIDLQKFHSESGRPHKRYVVVGTSGSGKSTLAGELAHQFGYPHVELDDINWLLGWKMRTDEEFRRLVDQESSKPDWIIDGNYTKSRDIVWPRADAIIWLDLPFRVVMSRIIWRSFWRGLEGRVMWGGCKASLKRGFLSRDSVVLWAARTWKMRRETYGEILYNQSNEHLDIFRVTSSDFRNIEVRRARQASPQPA